MAGDYSAKDPTLAKYHELVSKLIQELNAVHIENMPLRDNAEADSLAKSRKSTEVLSHPSIATMSIVTSEKGWKNSIKRYLTTSKLPDDTRKAVKVRRCSGQYFLIGEELYRQGYASPL